MAGKVFCCAHWDCAKNRPNRAQFGFISRSGSRSVRYHGVNLSGAKSFLSHAHSTLKGLAIN
jgi:hypothetical protein